MPELPEVETVKQGLKKIIKNHRPVIATVTTSGKKLRFHWPRGFRKSLSGCIILSVERRAKYLIFKTSGPTFICHLGMTGNWRMESEESQKKIHDHLVIHFQSNKKLIYNDARRFGYFDILKSTVLNDSKWFSPLGPEPLDEEEFNSSYLFVKCRNKKTSVKTLIMDQKIVVGVGNIYASEALFRSNIRPTRKAEKLTLNDCERLVDSIQQVLREAILQGGTTIRDFKSAGGSEGYFQQRLCVYGRESDPCVICAFPIVKKVIAGRSTFWCSKCQK